MFLHFRRNQWLKLIGRTDLLKKDNTKSYRVCSQHFEESMMSEVRMRKLLPHAVPTKCLPTESTDAQPQPSTSKNESNASDVSTQTKDSYVNVISVIKIKDATKTETQTQTEEPQVEKNIQTAGALSENTPRKRKLRTNLQESERKKRRLEIELDKIKKELEAKNSRSLSPPGDDDDEISKRFQQLLRWQEGIKNKYKGNRYSTEFKFFALNLHFSSPQTYRSLKSVLKLPSESTLSRFKLNIRPELDDGIFNAISKNLQSLPDAAKYCTICVDEMMLKRHLYYDIKHDEVIGLHNINGNVTNETVSNAYVVMLRGIVVNWKQPIAYALLASTKHYEELDDWMNVVISKLFSMGVVVKAIVSDQGSNFDKYAKEVKKVTPEKPYFTFDECKIYYIFDVPHLLKCIRNNLLTSDFYYEGKKVSWEYIEKLYSHQKEQNLRLIPKITNAHIEPNNFQKMRVKYAAQIFSRTVYGALNTFIFAKLLPEEAKATSEFVKLINDLFDILNSSKLKSNNKYQRAFNLNKDQLEVLDKAQNMFKKITAINRKKGTNTTNKIKSFKNFQITIQSIIMLSRDLKDEGFNFIFTRRLNQDPLENFFGAIRQQGGNCRDPTPIQFRRAFSKLFITNMLKSSPSSNCQEDLCDLLLNGNKILSEVTNTTITNDEQNRTEATMIVSLDGAADDYTFDLPTENAITYVSGYLLFKCSQKHHCSEFDTYVKNTPHLRDTNMFTHFKAFNNKSSFYGGLKLPPETFTNFIKEMENTFIKKFENVMLKHPANTLINLIKNISFTTPCPCFPSEFIFKLFVRFRIYAAIKFNNRYFREGKKYMRHYIKVKQL